MAETGSNTPLQPLRQPGKDSDSEHDSPSDYTGEKAVGRSLYINLGILRLGIVDQIQGAAIFFGVVLLVISLVIIIAMIFGQIKNDLGTMLIDWAGKFLLVSDR